MINSMQKSLINKDIKSIVSNKRLFPVLLIVPLVLTLFLPTIFILVIAFSPTESDDLKKILELLPPDLQSGNVQFRMVELMINSIIPIFFLLVPIMAASVTAASSFVGEKEKHTLETLLYCPLSLKQIFTAKILSSFLLSMLVSIVSFILMILVVEIETWILFNQMIIPNWNWLMLLLLISPAISLIAITLIVRGSAKAQTVEESQQRSVFLILPIILLAVGQFTGVMLISSLFLLILGILLAVIAWLAIKSSFRKFTYEMLFK